ncbi:MAG: hypothetical protein JXR77_04310 [Lentisphaeria bacterium]|nr:hypothetical protein [Lentisphaeria bacterium]
MALADARTIKYPLLLAPVVEAGDGADDLLRAYVGPGTGDIPSGSGCHWQVLDSPGRATRIRNGAAAGHGLGDAVRRFPRVLVGRRHAPGSPFPICCRLLQTAVDTPLSVFPEGGRPAPRGLPRGNDRFWYSLAAREDAVVISGIRLDATWMGFLRSVNTPSLRDLLQVYRPQPLDAFLAPSGRVHALGAGNLLLEIMQHADDPVRVSGWSDAEAVGPAELERAMSLVNFHDRQVRSISRDVAPMVQTRKVPLVTNCPAFLIEEVRLCDHLCGRTSGESFHLYVVVEGEVTVSSREGGGNLGPGEVVLIPAEMGEYRLEPGNTQQARLIKAGLPE